MQNSNGQIRFANPKKFLILASFAIFFLNSGCQKKQQADMPAVDVVLIGGGIMSATLGSMLTELDPNLHITIFEKLGEWPMKVLRP